MARKLKKEITLLEATLYGIGIILGAGIYALIGEGAGIAGSSLWMSFVLAAVIAVFTGLSYAELSSMFPKEAAEYVYTKNAFRKRSLSFIVSWVLIISLIVSGATVALGFAGYFSFLFGGDKIIIATALIFLLMCLNYIGIKESARFNSLSTVIEVGGLFLIIAAGIMFFGKNNIDYLAMPAGGLGSIIAASSLIFFAYIGFENVANISEETKNARKVIPKALMISIIFTTILYILVSVAAIAVVGPEALAQSHAPLTEVAVTAFGQNASILMTIIALFATANTVLVVLLVASRMLYGVSREHSLPKKLSAISRRGTPHIAIGLSSIVAVAALFIGNIKTIALITDVGIFIAYLFVNLALIGLRYRKPKVRRLFKAPVNIGKFPVLAFLGVISSIIMLLHFDPAIILYEMAIILLGIGIYKFFNR